jgi:hypothetical protein
LSCVAGPQDDVVPEEVFLGDPDPRTRPIHHRADSVLFAAPEPKGALAVHDAALVAEPGDVRLPFDALVAVTGALQHSQFAERSAALFGAAGRMPR